MKKIILSLTVLFLLFEVMYYDSNNKIEYVKENANKVVYDVAIQSNKQEFIKEYEDIILEENGDNVKLLTNEEDFYKMKNKYDFVIE